MARKYTFELTGDVLVARNHNDPETEFRIDPAVAHVQEGNIYAPWEKIIHAILGEPLTQGVDICSRSLSVSIPINIACENMVDSGIAENTAHARALLEYLDEESILDIEETDVVLHADPAGDYARYTAIYNFAVIFEMAVDTVDHIIEQAEELDEQLQRKLEEINSIDSDLVEITDPQEQIDEIHRELLSLEPTAETVGDIDFASLSTDKQRRYRCLQRSFHIVQSRMRTQTKTSEAYGDPFDRPTSHPLTELRLAFVEFETDLRTIASHIRQTGVGVTGFLPRIFDVLPELIHLRRSVQRGDVQEFAVCVDEAVDTAKEVETARQEVSVLREDEIRRVVAEQMTTER